MDIIRSDFKSGLESLLKTKPIRAIFLGVRIGDPTAVLLLSIFDVTILCSVLQFGFLQYKLLSFCGIC